MVARGPTMGQGPDMSRVHRNSRSFHRRLQLDRQSQQCGAKRKHADEATALAEIETLRAAGKSREKDGWVLHAYACPRCASWHVGHHVPGPS